MLSMIVKYHQERISLYKYNKYQQIQRRNLKQFQQHHQSHHQFLTLVLDHVVSLGLALRLKILLNYNL